MPTMKTRNSTAETEATTLMPSPTISSSPIATSSTGRPYPTTGTTASGSSR